MHKTQFHENEKGSDFVVFTACDKPSLVGNVWDHKECQLKMLTNTEDSESSVTSCCNIEQVVPEVSRILITSVSGSTNVRDPVLFFWGDARVRVSLNIL
jgi:hypothetical protein